MFVCCIFTKIMSWFYIIGKYWISSRAKKFFEKLLFKIKKIDSVFQTNMNIIQIVILYTEWNQSFFELIHISTKSPHMFIFLQCYIYIYIVSFFIKVPLWKHHIAAFLGTQLLFPAERVRIFQRIGMKKGTVFFPQAQGYAGEDELRSIHLTVRREFCSWCVHGISRGRIERDQRGG